MIPLLLTLLLLLLPTLAFGPHAEGQATYFNS